MAKKFSDNFDSLFDNEKGHEAEKDAQQGDNADSFVSGLEALLEESLQESLEEEQAADDNGSGKKPKRKITRKISPKAYKGLDLLIRNTLKPNEEKARKIANRQLEAKRRITVLLEEENIEQLREIAKMEKSYIKDLVSQIVKEYLEEKAK